MDTDSLGGFKNGPGNTDAVIRTISQTNSQFSGIGSYPLEGGYIYFNTSGNSLYAYKFSGGKFTLAGKSALTFAGKSVPTVTSLSGQVGGGVVWLAVVNHGPVAYKVVPVSGILQPITVHVASGLAKDRRPAFGNGRVYVTAQATLVTLA